ncbi:TPA: aromatic hydrocarbon degradation protein [Vibrio vulnificus]|uniref:outer membrane protein transport protein n=1 Tax=Vibrio vulnificus TaxID=672 RepID=UPI0010235FFE|nr:outer membrane protein transport protein [Vibrio vulnificus]EKY4882795.1 outer membrane protein transport protein [Vibrio vulnificus]ELY1393779.1 outer membrane protein transport protein [Vibrio vulnificus]MCG6276996.1 outer membrane protein transport protein [Vibrio vulnificus]RZQ22625.1 aromatic hydrocarbon degradation protein [Vibrio vulnificus]WNJ69527.1 outer membrane protein transport protein [Vibrio vulnificus]
MTQNMRLFKKSLLAVTVALASGQTMAAGFQLNAQSATGIGRAFAGDAVIADNAAVMARNPAAMALFDEKALSLGFETITTDITAKNVQYKGTSAESYDDAGGTSIAPNIHLIVPVNEKFAWGINAYSNFGTKTDFSNDLSWSEYGGLTDVKSVNLGVAGSYRLNEQWSFGLGLDLIYGSGKLERKAGAGTSTVLPLPANQCSAIGGTVIGTMQCYVGAPKGTSLVNAEADGFGVGFNVGTVFELDENNRFGLSYRHSPEIEAEGDVQYLTNADSNGKLHMPLPDIAEFSGYHKIKDTKFAVHYSVQYIGWKAFDKLDATINGTKTTLNEYNWQDGWHYSIGGTYFLNNEWTVRGGYMYDTSAQDKTTSVSVPDSDRQWFSAGATYHIDDKSNVDIGFTYLVGKDVQVNETTGAGPIELSSISATTRANAILFGLQYSRTF